MTHTTIEIDRGEVEDIAVSVRVDGEAAPVGVDGLGRRWDLTDRERETARAFAAADERHREIVAKWEDR